MRVSRTVTLAYLPIPSAFTIVVVIPFYSRTTCSRLSLYHVCCCRCSRFCAVRWYTCGRGTDVFVDLCHHHLQICVCVISGRGSRRFTGGFVLQLHLHNSSSMEVTRDPFQSVSENDDDGELTSRRMRLFPDCGRLTCVLPCLCIVGMIYSTVAWLLLFFHSLRPLEGSYYGGIAATVIFSVDAIASIFAMVFTLYACPSRRTLPCWQPGWRRVAPLGLLAAILQIVLLLLTELGCELDQQACDEFPWDAAA